MLKTETLPSPLFGAKRKRPEGCSASSCGELDHLPVPPVGYDSRWVNSPCESTSKATMSEGPAGSSGETMTYNRSCAEASAAAPTQRAKVIPRRTVVTKRDFLVASEE